MRKKILITYATAGVGHKKAAEAIYHAFQKNRPDVDVRLVDILHYTNFIFKDTYCVAYLFLIRHLIFFWGLLYHSLNLRVLHYLTNPLRKFTHILSGKRFIKYLLEYKPDLVISTHFMPADICGYVKRKYKANIHVSNVITDYRAHSFWVSDAVDTYFVGHPIVQEELILKWRVPSANVKVTGIPIEEKFYKDQDIPGLKARLGIPPDSFTVLLLSGGYAIGPIMKTIRLLNKAKFSLTTIAICGHNEKLLEEIENFKKGAGIRILNLGFVNNIDELMSVSDICIGKSGGISISEAFAKALPFILVRPIPGQEAANAELLLKVGGGIRLKKLDHILEVIEDLRLTPGKINAMKESMKNVRKVHAANHIAEISCVSRNT